MWHHWDAMKKSIYWAVAAILGLGILYVGLAASWPGPNNITLAMMAIGLSTFLVAACLSIRSCFTRFTHRKDSAR
jgi:hypothetical protein